MGWEFKSGIIKNRRRKKVTSHDGIYPSEEADGLVDGCRRCRHWPPLPIRLSLPDGKRWHWARVHVVLDPDSSASYRPRFYHFLVLCSFQIDRLMMGCSYLSF